MSSGLAMVSPVADKIPNMLCLARHSAGGEGGRLSRDVCGSQLFDAGICNLHSVE